MGYEDIVNEAFGIENPVFNKDKLSAFMEATYTSTFQYEMEEYNVNDGGCAIMATLIARYLEIPIGKREYIYLHENYNLHVRVSARFIDRVNDLNSRWCSSRHIMLHIGNGILLDTDGIKVLDGDISKLKFSNHADHIKSIVHGGWNPTFSRANIYTVNKIIKSI